MEKRRLLEPRLKRGRWFSLAQVLVCWPAKGRSVPVCYETAPSSATKMELILLRHP